MNTSNELRLFISSTFRDLQEEREHLVKKIFPEIRALCRERGVTFTDVDLRWGLTEEEASLGRVIRTCLEEVDKCRPYFIGMIGNRYGWVPELHDILMDPDLLAKYPFVEDLAIEEASVTEMEFIHGVFDAPMVDGEYAFFYRRSDDLTESDDPDRLTSLISRAQATGRPFREFASIEELGESVRADLVAMIEANWPESEAPSELDLERRSHAAFAASRTRAYIPNPLYLKEFTTWLNTGTAPLVISGESGLGKSSLVAYMTEYYHRKNPEAFVVAHYVGASQSSGTAFSVMRHIVEAIRVRFEIEEELPTKADELQRSFANWLFRCEHLARQEGIEVLIVIDAVNQLDEASRLMGWLPKTIPTGVGLIVTTTPGDTANQLAAREWESLEVVPLEDERVRQSIVVRYLGEYHKGIGTERLHRLISDSKGETPLYLRVVAEELRLHGEHETLDEVIDRYSAATDLLSVFDLVLDRMERDYGESVVRDLLSLISSSRSGLSEDELLALMGVSRLELSRLIFAFDYHLLRRDGLLSFFHDYLHRAVRERYLVHEAERRNLHLRLVDHFHSMVPGQHSSRELLWQYRQIEDDAAMAEYLGRMDVFGILFSGSGEDEVQQAWAWLRSQGHDPSTIYSESLSTFDTGDSSELQIRMQVGMLLERLGEWDATMNVYQGLLDESVRVGNTSYEAMAHRSLGVTFLRRGAYDEALVHFEEARVKYESLGDQSGVAPVVSSTGRVYMNRGEYDRALEYFEYGLSLCEELGDQSGIAFARESIGNVCSIRGEHDRALENFQQMMNVCENLGNHRDVSLAIGNMGSIYMNRGEYHQALECLSQTLQICEDLGERVGISVTVGNIGSVYIELGEYDRARDCFERRLKICEELGDRRGTSIALGCLGQAYSHLSEYDHALDSFQRAIEGHREIGFRHGLLHWLNSRAEILLALSEESVLPDVLMTRLPDDAIKDWQRGTLEWARVDAEESVAISRELNTLDMLYLTGPLLARINAALGRQEVGLQQLAELLEQAGDDIQRAECHYWLWKLNPGYEDHRAEAIRLFEAVSAADPSQSYQERIDELRKSPLSDNQAD